ncbi:VOC family protein [Chelativorans intermedius]|uniref:VOC family protein n=1 Tax=Chelativorans intermedius TaxID=515947 RepID=A0ABV6DBS3_9HYPH|nr:VOC family protein [Chelativorans intermedius]MCT8998755.1 VOC family protein [Chelativorans intermedius]
MRPKFEGGRNIAMKVPPHHFDATVRFYRDVLGLETIESLAPDIVFVFGANRLWIDRVPGMSQTEIWLEVATEDREAAAEHLAREGVSRRDEIEPLPEGFPGFWVAGPGDIIHLIHEQGA